MSHQTKPFKPYVKQSKTYSWNKQNCSKPHSYINCPIELNVTIYIKMVLCIRNDCVLCPFALCVVPLICIRNHMHVSGADLDMWHGSHTQPRSFLLKRLQDLQTNSLQSRHWRLLLTRNLKGCRQRMQSESLSLGWYSSSSLFVSSFIILVLSSLHE